MENSVVLPALRAQSMETAFSNGASAVHLKGKTSCCASLKEPILYEVWATDLLRRSSLAFHCEVRINFTHGCDAPQNDPLRLRFTAVWPEKCTLRCCFRSSTLRHRRELSPDWSALHDACSRDGVLADGRDDDGANAVETRTFCTDRTRRCCRRLLRTLYVTFLLQQLCSRGRVLLKNIGSMIAVVISFVEVVVRRHAAKKGLLDVLRFW